MWIQFTLLYGPPRKRVHVPQNLSSPALPIRVRGKLGSILSPVLVPFNKVQRKQFSFSNGQVQLSILFGSCREVNYEIRSYL